MSNYYGTGSDVLTNRFHFVTELRPQKNVFTILAHPLTSISFVNLILCRLLETSLLFTHSPPRWKFTACAERWKTDFGAKNTFACSIGRSKKTFPYVERMNKHYNSTRWLQHYFAYVYPKEKCISDPNHSMCPLALSIAANCRRKMEARINAYVFVLQDFFMPVYLCIGDSCPCAKEATTVANYHVIVVPYSISRDVCIFAAVSIRTISFSLS